MCWLAQVGQYKYKLNAQYLRLFGVHSDVNDAHRAGANRLQNKTILQEKGDNSLQHYNLVHTFIPMHQAMKILAAKAAVDKEWEKI